MKQVPFDDLNPGDRLRVVLRSGQTVEGKFAGFAAHGKSHVLRLRCGLELPDYSMSLIVRARTETIDKVFRLGR